MESPLLRLDMPLRRTGQAKVSILYLADVANLEVLQELEERIGKLDVDVDLNTGELSEMIEDNPFSPFPQFAMTERPDAAAYLTKWQKGGVIVHRFHSQRTEKRYNR